MSEQEWQKITGFQTERADHLEAALQSSLDDNDMLLSTGSDLLDLIAYLSRKLSLAEQRVEELEGRMP